MDQQLRLARVVLEDAQAKHQQVIVDLVFAGNQIRRGNEYYGVWRDQNEQAICPFVMNANGEVDFGIYAGEDRFYQFDILNGQIGLGQQLAWRNDEYETQMVVIGVTQLI